MAAEEAVKTEEEKDRHRERSRLEQCGVKKRKCLCTQARVIVEICKSMAVIPRQGDITCAIKKHESRISRAWVDFRGGIASSQCTLWHSEGMPTRNEELLETLWNLIGVK